MHSNESYDGSTAPEISPEVRKTLRRLITQNGLVRAADFDHAATLKQYPDAAILIEALHHDGFLTPRQVESFLNVFTEQQRATALRIAQSITTQNFITDLEAQAATKTYEEVLLTETFLEHLVHDGYLTSTQAAGLQKFATASASSAPAWLKNKWVQKVPTDKIIAHALKLRDIHSRNRKKSFAIGIPLVLLLCGLLFYAMSNKAEPLEPHCTMNGNGRGTCTFSNTGSRANGSCGHVTAWCSRITNSRSSTTMCSGQVAPRDSKQMDFSIPSFDRMTPDRGDWRDACSFIWVDEND